MKKRPSIQHMSDEEVIDHLLKQDAKAEDIPSYLYDFPTPRLHRILNLCMLKFYDPNYKRTFS